MAQLAAPARSIGRRIRDHWRGIAVVSALVLIFGSFAITALNGLSGAIWSGSVA